MANDGVSMREFARQVGRSAAYVSGKCKTGELPLVDGKIPLEEGLKAFKALVKSEERKKASRRTSRKTADVFTSDDEDDKQISSALNVNEAFNKARLAKEVATAKIKDFEYKKLKGEYVSISAPTRYSALLENRTQREAEEVLEDIFRDLLKTINDSHFAKGG